MKDIFFIVLLIAFIPLFFIAEIFDSYKNWEQEIEEHNQKIKKERKWKDDY